METLLKYVELLRVKHWIKNILIFVPAFFTREIINRDVFVDLSFAFFSFSLTASAVYILNDYVDVKKDRMHPRKKNRPIASGAISKKQAIIMFLGVVIINIFVLNFVSRGVWIYFGIYFVLNILYTFKLKHISIVDVMIISFGFLLRIYLGGEVSDVLISKWLIVMTFLLSLLIASAKRRSELISLKKNHTRKALDGYSITFLDHSITLLSSVTVIAYIMYTLSENVVALYGDSTYLNTFFVIFGILRYLQLMFVYNQTETPTTLLFKDRILQVNILGWLLSFVYFIYI